VHKILAVASLLAVLAMIARPREQELAEPSPGLSTEEIEGTFFSGIFFAILEGLYRDGVSNAAVDAVLALEPTSGLRANFVNGCPICTPALNAFRNYRARLEFEGLKARCSTFGPGLAPDVEARLVGADAGARRQAVEELVGRWIREWLDARRSTEAERAAWAEAMEKGRKLGMSLLQAQRERYAAFAGMEECPMCEGGVTGARR
jgi:hypothetical protein